MKLRETILAEHSKANCIRIVQWIGHDQHRFNQLFELFLTDTDPIIIQRSGWPLSYAVEAHPDLIQKHFSRLLKKLQQPNLHNAVKRNTLRILQLVAIPEKFHGEVMTIAFDYIISPVEKPAIKSFSLAVLQQLAKQYPDIVPEIKTIIEENWDTESAAFRSRAKHILKEFSK